MIVEQGSTIEPTRLRCRGDRHRPGCAHLGADPVRIRCRGDKHRPGCGHLTAEPRPIGRPKANRRRDAALAREAERRTKTGLISADDPQDSGEPEGDHNTHKSRPLIGPYPRAEGVKQRPIHGATKTPVIEPCPRCSYAYADGGYCESCGWSLPHPFPHQARRRVA